MACVCVWCEGTHKPLGASIESRGTLLLVLQRCATPALTVLKRNLVTALPHTLSEERETEACGAGAHNWSSSTLALPVDCIPLQCSCSSSQQPILSRSKPFQPSRARVQPEFDLAKILGVDAISGPLSPYIYPRKPDGNCGKACWPFWAPTTRPSGHFGLETKFPA